MNYRKVYVGIIQKARKEMELGLRKKNKIDYYEAHHILPKSIFPKWKNKKSNKVLLTAREHFFCHQLLIKIYPVPQMYLCLHLMSKLNKYKVSSKEYERIRVLWFHNCRQYCSSIKGKKCYTNGTEIKYFFENEVPPGWQKSYIKYDRSKNGKLAAKTRKLRGYKCSEETKQKMREAAIGRKFTEAHKKNLKLHHHLRTSHIILYKDFSYTKFEGGVKGLCTKYNVSEISLKRCSRLFDFKFGFLLLDLVNNEEAFNHRYAGISSREKVFENPLTKEIVGATSYRIYRQHHYEECKKFEHFPWTKEMKQKKLAYNKYLNKLKEDAEANLPLLIEQEFLCGM